MKAWEIIAALEKVDPDTEVYRDEEVAVCTPVQDVAFECVRHIDSRTRQYTDVWIVILQ